MAEGAFEPVRRGMDPADLTVHGLTLVLGEILPSRNCGANRPGVATKPWQEPTKSRYSMVCSIFGTAGEFRPCRALIGAVGS